MGEKWTTEELEFVRENYFRMKATQIAKVIKRPSTCIGRQAKRMGLVFQGNEEILESRSVHRFYDQIKKVDSGCWEWQGTLNNWGYGMTGVKGKAVSTHRFSYELHKGDIPEGLLVCHRCDNPKCCNPEHLFLGTNADNIGDSVRKGRHSSQQHRKDRQESS